MHTNLFSKGHSKDEVQLAMEQDQKNDSLKIRILDVIFVGALIFLVRSEPFDMIIAYVLLGFTGLTALRIYIDQSIRNFYLHPLDWDEETRRAGTNS